MRAIGTRARLLSAVKAGRKPVTQVVPTHPRDDALESSGCGLFMILHCGSTPEHAVRLPNATPAQAPAGCTAKPRGGA